jgi:hypothetical protein
LVNETVPDGDTTYVQDGTSGDQDLLNMSSMGTAPAVITGVMSNLYLENPSSGSINFNHVCKSGAAAANASASTIAPASYQTMQASYPTDPNTSAAWTAANLDAAQFGYKVT